jgi:hypothetical protein
MVVTRDQGEQGERKDGRDWSLGTKLQLVRNEKLWYAIIQ